MGLRAGNWRFDQEKILLGVIETGIEIIRNGCFRGVGGKNHWNYLQHRDPNLGAPALSGES
jgi:hypothetical protein